MNELREHRLAVASGDDVLQLYSTLWYAWISLNQTRTAVSVDCERYPEAGTQDELCLDHHDDWNVGMEDSRLNITMMAEARSSITMDVSVDYATSSDAMVVRPML